MLKQDNQLPPGCKGWRSSPRIPDGSTWNISRRKMNHGDTETITEERRTVGPFHVEHFLKWAIQTVPRGTFLAGGRDGSPWNISPFRREPDGSTWNISWRNQGGDGSTWNIFSNGRPRPFHGAFHGSRGQGWFHVEHFFVPAGARWFHVEHFVEKSGGDGSTWNISPFRPMVPRGTFRGEIRGGWFHVEHFPNEDEPRRHGG